MTTKTCDVRTDNFRVSIQAGTTQRELFDIVQCAYENDAHHGIAVVPDIAIMEITEEDILRTLGGSILNTMTLEQRARAIDVVRSKFVMPQEVYIQITNLLKDNFTHIVFGDE